MVQLASFVFLRRSREDIVEISLVACSKEHLLTTEQGKLPRVLHKQTLCVDPEKEIRESVDKNVINEMVQEESSGESSQGCRAALIKTTHHQEEGIFDESTVQLLPLFLKRLQPPVCLVAHNGKENDFLILKQILQNLYASLPDETYCFDLFSMFGQLPQTESSQEQAAPAKKQCTLADRYKEIREEPHKYFHKAEWDAIALLKCVTYAKDYFVMRAERECIEFNPYPSNPDTEKIIRVVSYKIEKACEKVIKEVSTTVLTSVEAMLKKTADLELKLDTGLQYKFDQYPEASSSFQFALVTTKKEIEALEEHLKDKLYAKQLFLHMKRKIGNTGDARDGLDTAYGLIDHFFDWNLMLLCCWTGDSKDGNMKHPMKKCVNILDIFFKLVHSVNNTFSRTLLKFFFKEITSMPENKVKQKAKDQKHSAIHRRAKTGNNKQCNTTVSFAPDHPSSSTIPVHDCNNLVEPNENEDAQDSGTRSDNRRVEEVFQEDDDGDKLLASVALHNLI